MKLKLCLLVAATLLIFAGCKKDKATTPAPEALPAPENEAVVDNGGVRLQAFVDSCSGIWEAEDGNLISVYPPHEESAYTDDFLTFAKFAVDCPLPVWAAIPPRKMDALALSLPEDFPVEHTEYIYSLARSAFSESDAVFVDLYSALVNKSEYAGELYYMTDHHWTGRGAWLAYCELGDKMGFEPLSYESFEQEIVSDNWRGSDFTKKNTSTSFDIYSLPVGAGFEVELVQYPFDSDENNRRFEGFSDPEASGVDTLLLGGNNPYVRVSKTGEKRETLLIVRDSFANALAPYLAEHFDLVLIDPRFYAGRLSQVAEREGVFGVLILENLGSISEHSVKFMW